MYNLLKNERQELAKQKSREAYSAKEWNQDQNVVVTFKRCIYAPTRGGLWLEIIKANLDLP